MAFKDLDIRRRYRSDDYDNIGEAFLEYVLRESVSYDRAAGFFSSSSLVVLSRGLLKVAAHYKSGDEPVIRFVVSPRLTETDVDAIEKGYKSRETVITEALLRSFLDPETYEEKERLNVLTHLISSGAMDIKVAVKPTAKSLQSMYHEKFGVMLDSEGNGVAFSGSLNESHTAFEENFESIEVFKNWDISRDYYDDIKVDFGDLWGNQTKNLVVVEFPKAVKARLFQYHRDTYDAHIDDRIGLPEGSIKKLPGMEKNKLISLLYDYQKEAVNSWFRKRCRGIFDMATGTGKTYTGYAAMVSLLQKKEGHLAVVIVCPYQHLVEQWLEDAETFEISNIVVGYSNPKYKDYRAELTSHIYRFNNSKDHYFFFITTTASYRLTEVQNLLKSINGPALFVADEAHNMGSATMADKLLPLFKYRLALSATVDRYRDEVGTKQIYDYFGEKCIEYPLERAIEEGKLTRYEYYPILISLDDCEREQYKALTAEIIKHMYKDKDGNSVISESAKTFVMKRARLIAVANQKTVALKEEIQKQRDDHYILVYCGTGKIDKGSEGEIKQIDEVTRMLGLDLKMKVERYTSRESVQERQIIRDRFKNGDDLQALVAIKCLDEGVNIPGIRTAYILASSTNPREYIQRRGRVLRLAKGKKKAIIYDFVCLPYSLKEAEMLPAEEKSIYRTLVNNELNRMNEFGTHAINTSLASVMCERIKDSYGFYDFDVNDYLELNGGNDDE